MASAAGVRLAAAPELPAATGPHGRKAFIRGAFVAGIGFILYASVAGAIATYAVRGGPWSPAADKAAGAPRDVRLPTLQPHAATPIVVGITVVDGDCTDYCVATLSVHCTTTSDRISTDWIIVPRMEFDSLHRDVGCE